ncbi:MAG: hypothetical protein F6J86_30210 [Symploca sp. SIO1B1]|nr:hypothetical protein [Symploca sp. SIO1C2]NER98055.1 hypothetical protein [Symploca sp. SIO1B1]
MSRLKLTQMNACALNDYALNACTLDSVGTDPEGRSIGGQKLWCYG